MTVFDIETFKTNRDVRHANFLYKLSKISGKYTRVKSDREIEKCKEGCIVSKGTENTYEMLDHSVQFKGEPKRFAKRIFKKIYTY